MISPFDTHPAIFNRKDGSVLTISRNGVLCKDKNGKVTCDVDFDDVNGLHCSGYLNSNNNYHIIFRGTDWIQTAKAVTIAIIFLKQRPLLPPFFVIN